MTPVFMAITGVGDTFNLFPVFIGGLDYVEQVQKDRGGLEKLLADKEDAVY